MQGMKKRKELENALILIISTTFGSAACFSGSFQLAVKSEFFSSGVIAGLAVVFLFMLWWWFIETLNRFGK
jgi:hypothetical protein